MSERIAYQHNRDHILKFAGMEKLTGGQIVDELNRLYTIIAEQNEEIAALEREVEVLTAKLEQEQQGHLETIEERDLYHEWADELAAAIGSLLGKDFGEHTSANNPWERALDAAKRSAPLEREVEALRSLLSDVTCVAITMLYDTHKQDVLDEFTTDELKEVVSRAEHLQIEKVEHIYRRGFEALAGGEAG